MGSGSPSARCSEREAEGRGSPAASPAWGELETFRPMLFKFLMQRCRDEHEADDVIQETFLRAARYRKHLANRARMRSWVVQIAFNVFRDHVRRSQQGPSSGCDDEALEGVEGDEPAPGEVGEEVPVDLGCMVVDKDLALHYLKAAFADLVDRDRRVLSSFYGGAESTSATAAECGISPALVKVRLFRARRRLRAAVCALASERRARRLARVPYRLRLRG